MEEYAIPLHELIEVFSNPSDKGTFLNICVTKSPNSLKPTAFLEQTPPFQSQVDQKPPQHLDSPPPNSSRY